MQHDGQEQQENRQPPPVEQTKQQNERLPVSDSTQSEQTLTAEQTDKPEGTILHVAQPGYVLGERVIRPAQVSVASTPLSISDTPAQQKDPES